MFQRVNDFWSAINSTANWGIYFESTSNLPSTTFSLKKCYCYFIKWTKSKKKINRKAFYGGLNTLNITVRYIDFNGRLLNYIVLAACNMQNNLWNNQATWWDIPFFILYRTRWNTRGQNLAPFKSKMLAWNDFLVLKGKYSDCWECHDVLCLHTHTFQCGRALCMLSVQVWEAILVCQSYL